MIPDTVTRYGATIKGKFIKRADLLRHYVCNTCGGTLIHRFEYDPKIRDTRDLLQCGECGGKDIVRESRFLQEISDGFEVVQGLPPELRALVERRPTCQSRTEAIADLYG